MPVNILLLEIRVDSRFRGKGEIDGTIGIEFGIIFVEFFRSFKIGIKEFRIIFVNFGFNAGGIKD